LATNRIYVQLNVLSQLRERLHQAVNALQVGDGTRQNVQMGPLINQQAIDKVSHHVADATAKGATIECGGEAIPGAGYFYTPTILSNASETMTLAHEETFGPVAPLFTFDTEDEVYERANGTPYGLVAYVFTKNLARAMRAIGALDFGVVGVNDPGPSLVEAPLGGVKASGLGREGGHEGIEEFLETKYVSMRY
jgi:succinate-semialdehyde dehydrogenase/glutarate-semialdehyde dehydrogenase